MTRLVGLLGKARVGKDTAAAHLTDQHLFTQYAFADPLKEMLEAVFGDRFRGGDRETPIWWLGKSPRHLMQTLGTEWGRQHVHPDLWVLLANLEWQRCKARNYLGVVVSDVRFDNEAEWVTREGGLLIEIRRPDAEQIADHRSESGVSLEWPRVLVINDGTIEELHERIDEAVSDFFGDSERMPPPAPQFGQGSLSHGH